mgnify:CR=1 FL=1
MQTEVLYKKAVELADLKGDETVLDLYCGIGTISLFFARKARQVFGVEIVPEAIADARKTRSETTSPTQPLPLARRRRSSQSCIGRRALRQMWLWLTRPERAVMHACWKRFSKLPPKRSCMFPVTCDTRTGFGCACGGRLPHTRGAACRPVPSYKSCRDGCFDVKKIKSSARKRVFPGFLRGECHQSVLAKRSVFLYGNISTKRIFQAAEIEW